MPRATNWSDLTIGLIAFAAITAAVIGVLVFAKIGALHGDTTTIYMVTNKANRVIKGTDVWLGGQRVGVVDAIDFRAPATDTAERIAIRMLVLSEYMPHLRHDSDIQIRPGGSLIGEPVVYMTIGTGRAPAVHAGDTLRAREQVLGRRRVPVTATIAALSDSIVKVGTAVRQIVAHGESRSASVTQIRTETQRQATAVSEAMERFSNRFQHTRSAAGGSRDAALRAAVAGLRARSDSVQRLLASDRTSLGRFRRG